MSETFHPFPSLPTELRLAIWKLALRSEGSTRPGAHFFGILVLHQDEDADSLISHSLLRRGWIYDPHSRLIGPRFTAVSTEDRSVGIKQVPASWTVNNPSTYLIDSGLWLACWESRLTSANGTFSSYPYKLPMPSQSDAQVSLDHPDRFIVVYPDKDLFCFQPYDWYTWDLGGDFYNFLVDTFNGRVKNAAIEYNPQWAGGDHELKIFDNFFHLAIGSATLAYLESVWFIDYRIKRRHHLPTKEQSEAPLGEVFYQDGRRFIEVDINYEDSPWEQYFEVAEGEWISCKTFVLDLREACQDQLDSIQEMYLDDDGEEWAPFLGVLACVED
ncbi:2EXR domain-containing protein [Fusarium sp. LHS14.1]|nr:2EXR domain-containing protein [Fusarium sp. LHS14.1]